jgi:hypothetical protein
LKKTTKKKASKKKPVIVHKFDLKSLFDFVKHLISSEQARNVKQTYNSLTFHRQLNKQKPLSFATFKVDFNDPLYRVSAFGATSITGNLAYGGRFNVGGSQFNKLIGIKPFAALYLSTDLHCAIDEYTQGTPLGPSDVQYALTPSKNFELWDIDKVVKFLNFPNLNNLINQGPIFSSWGYCKVPMQSQILASWLKKIGGDGVIFRSTQSTGSYCIALFAKDNAHSNALFSQVKNI